jgi:S-adenosylmethionine hydrolase
MAHLVAILTDFGDLDPYVGIMKGVIAGIAPNAATIDLTHNIAPGDIQAAAFALLQAVPYFPPGTVYLTVVDPGVGSRRRPIAAAAGPAFLVGPDNGVFTYVYEHFGLQAAVVLADPRYRLSPVSNTFHGRDIFAPAAAHLVRGVALEALGPEARDPVRLPLPRFSQTSANEIAGQVLHGDRFGNLASSIAWLDWRDETTLEITPWLAGRVAPRRFDARRARVTVAAGGLAQPTTFDGIHRTFSDVPAGQAAIIVGSERHLDIVVNRGSAVERLGAQSGDEVLLALPSDA